MSLVNDMLKDLDTRNAQMPERMPDAISIPSGHRAGANPIFVLALFAMALSVAVYLLGSLTAGVNETDQVAEEAAASQTVAAVIESQPLSEPVAALDISGVDAASNEAGGNDAEVAALAELPAPAAGKKMAPPVITTPQSSLASATNTRVENLLNAADAALASHKLTTPAGDNAWDYLREVMAIDPDNARAHASVDAIVEAYVGLVDEQVKQNNMTQAGVLLARGLSVNPADARLQKLNTELQNHATPALSAGTAVAAAPKIDRLPSQQERALNLLVEAQALWAQGQTARALGLLQSYIESNAGSGPVTLQLFDWQGALGNWQAAEQVLRRSQQLPRDYKALMSARLLVNRDDAEAAITLLQENAPPVAEAVNYHAYLAGLYQKQQNYRAAADLYRQLLAVDAKQPMFWLGLGVALDALQDRQALQAYLQIGSNADLNDDVRRFVLQRIQALSS